MTKIKSATEAFIEYNRIWGSRHPDTLDKVRAFTGDEFTAIGTAKHDIFRNPEEIYEQWIKESRQIHGETFEIIWIEEKQISECVFIVNCEIVWTRALDWKPSTSIPQRITTVWRRDSENWKIVGWHSSVPDGAQEDEIFPGSLEPRFYENISVVFTDFVGFTTISASVSPKILVRELNELFSTFDKVTEKKGLKKIKTIGDAYMLAGGLSAEASDHARVCIEWGMEIISYLNLRNKYADIDWKIRIGINSGPAIGGFIGEHNKVFDLWGKTVNNASRLEQASAVNRINISESTFKLVKDHYECEFRGKVKTKDGQIHKMYFVNDAY
jgi:class 3 adenylate cyclase